MFNSQLSQEKNVAVLRGHLVETTTTKVVSFCILYIYLVLLMPQKFLLVVAGQENLDGSTSAPALGVLLGAAAHLRGVLQDRAVVISTQNNPP